MSLRVDDLSWDELRVVMSLLRICCKCEKEIPITDDEYGSRWYCGCICHSDDCPSPEIREYHNPSICSLDLKRSTIRGFLNNQDLSTAILQKLRDDCPNLLILLDWSKNATETLNNQEIVLLIQIFKICYKCGNRINGTNCYRPICGCNFHGSNCQSHQNRSSHPKSCSYEFRAQTVEMYNISENGNIGEILRTCMIDNYPNLIKAICFENGILDLSLQVKLLRQELDNAKQESLQANNEKESLKQTLRNKKMEIDGLKVELTKMSLKSLNLKTFFATDLNNEKYCGHGSFGAVSFVDTTTGRIAIKRYVNGPNLSHKDKNEIFHMLEVCNHKNFIRILGVLYENEESRINNPFPNGFVMEYMDGGSLHSLIHNEEEEYNIEEIFNWIVQASEGLLYLHEKNIIHRDVKPDNMMLSNARKTLKLGDLGLSRIHGSTNTSGRGTLCYMAPEVASPNHNERYNQSCDVYSLAISIWEMVHRRLPFDEGNQFRVIECVLNRERPPIKEDCDLDLRRLIIRSWEHFPEVRMTMREIHEFSLNWLKKN